MIISYSLPSEPPESFETDTNSIVFGRNPSSDQHVDLDLVADEYVSRLHACLTCENEEYWIEDLGSANGTWLNEEQISGKTRLAPGDKVKVGYTIIEVQAAAEPASNSDLVLDSADLVKKIDDPEALISDIEAQVVPVIPVAEPEPPSDSGDLVEEIEDPEDLISELFQALDSPASAGEPAVADSSIPDLEPDKPILLVEPVESALPVSEPGPAADSFEICTPAEKDVQPVSEPAPEGTVVDLADVTTHSFAMSGSGSTDEMLTQSWRQLTAFNDLCQLFNQAETLDALVKILVEHLRQAIPNAQRGAVLLPDERDELLLKAHWPSGDHSISMTWIKRAYNRREPFIWSATESDQGDDTPHSVIYYKVQSAIYVPLLLGDRVLGVMYVDNHLSRNAFFATDLELMRAIANQVAMFVRDHVLRKDLRREEELRAHMSRQFSPKIASRIFGNNCQLRIGGEKVDPVTILVSDVRSFTALSSTMAPDDVVRMLNEMFDAFVPIIFDHDGVVDKYVGDSVLAVFGSPEKDDRQCEKAVQAALEMQRAVHKLGEGRSVRRLPVFAVGISVHTGAVIHGFIGSAERMEYTVIGDTVNRASRYCDGAAAGEVVISKTVFERVYHLVNVEPKLIRTKHPDIEPDLEAFIVKGLKKNGPHSVSSR